MLTGCTFLAYILLLEFNDFSPQMLFFSGIIIQRENKEKCEWERTEALIPRTKDSRCGEQLVDYHIEYRKS